MKKAFTMIEIIFVIVILGILSSVAISKMAVTRDDAQIVKGKANVVAIRNAIMLTRSTNMLQAMGAAWPTKLDALAATSSTEGDALFDFDSNSSDNNARLLDYPLYAKNQNGHWRKTANNEYVFKVVNTEVDFTYNTSGRGLFDCDHNNVDVAKKKYCKALTE